MDKKIKEAMFKGIDGTVSSTRVMAWNTWMFTKWVIAGFLIVITMLSVIDAIGWMTIKETSIKLINNTYTYTLVALFIAIYTPKSFKTLADAIGIWIQKRKETKETIE